MGQRISIGGVLSGTARAVGRRWVLLFGIAALGVGLRLALSALLQRGTNAIFAGSFGSAPLALRQVPGEFTYVLFDVVFGGALCWIVYRDRRGASLAWPYGSAALGGALLALFAPQFLIGVMRGGAGFLLFFAAMDRSARMLTIGPFVIVAWLILFVILNIRWWVIAPVIMIERVGPLRALGRSSSLIKGNFWRVLAIAIVLVAVTRVPMFVIEFMTQFRVGGAGTFTIIGAANFLLETLRIVATAACVTITYLALGGGAEEDVSETFS
jgi:hypothetical protein